MNTIIFSAGVKGNGWRGVADYLQRVLFHSSSGEKKANRMEEARNYQHPGSGRRVDNQSSYVNVIKKFKPNRDDF